VIGVPPRDGSPVALILAAGEGSRLRTDGADLPKPLVRLRGQTIAERAISQLQAAGVGRFVVSLGCEAARVRREFERARDLLRCDVSFVESTSWEKGNGCSALAAASSIGDHRFLLTMVDHLLDPEMIRDLLRAPLSPRDVALAVDHDIAGVFDLPDLTKVSVSDGWIVAIGKDLPTYDAGDTGLFSCSPRLFEGLARAQERGDCSLSHGIEECIARGGVRAVDVTGRPWLDVDTPEAFEEATRRIDAAAASDADDAEGAEASD